MEQKSFKDLFTFTQDLALILRGRDLVVEFANPAHLSLIGEDVTGRTLFEIYPHEKQFLSQVVAVRESGSSSRAQELRLQIAHHSYIFQMTYSFIDNEDPTRQGVMVLGHDITEDIMSRHVTSDQKIALELALNDADFTHILKILIESSERILGPRAQCCILISDESETELVYGATSRLPKKFLEEMGKVFIKDNNASCGTTAFRRRPLFIRDVQTHEYWYSKREITKKFNVKSCYSVPIFSSRGNVLGTFAVYNHFEIDLRPFEERLVALMADTVGVIIERAEEVQIKREVESILNETQERLNSAVAAAKIGFFDVKLGRNVFFLSDQMQQDWNLPSELDFSEINRLYDRIHPEDRERVIDNAQKCFRVGKAYIDEYRICPEPNQIRWVQVNGSVERGADGGTYRFFGTCVDITQKKAEVLARAESESLFKLVTDAVPVLISYVTPDLKYKFVNAFYEVWFKKPLNEIVGQSIDILFKGESLSVRKPYLLRALAGEHGRLEAPYWTEQEEKRYMLSMFIPDFDKQGNVRGIIVMAMDTTQEAQAADAIRVAKEAAEAANASKSEFLANMSHEIRTPLGAILGYAQFMKTELAEKKRGQYVENILKNGKALIRILDDILDLSKVEAGKMDIELTRFELKPFIEEILDLFRERASEKDLSLFLEDYSLQNNEAVMSDPLRLRQILVNLIGNAIKFTHKGQIEVRVERRSGERIAIQIMDTGIGLSFEQSQKLFTAFTQADTSVTREYGGTGLGLHLSRRLAERLGGQLTLVISEVGVGSVFEVEFPQKVPLSDLSGHPVDTAHPEAIHSQVVLAGEIKRSPILAKSLSDLKVLVADDSEDNREIITLFLNSIGVINDTAENGEVVLKMASEKKYDLILMDIQMPVLDGYAAVKALRARGEMCTIWALTAHAMQQERDKSLGVGCDDHLTKPIQFDEVQLKLMRLIEPTQAHTRH